MFTDIKTEAFSTEEINAINFVSNAGIICGYMDGSFQPFILVTNAELCRTGYDRFTPEQSQKAAQEFLSSIHEFRAKNSQNTKNINNLYLEVRKGYRHGK